MLKFFTFLLVVFSSTSVLAGGMKLVLETTEQKLRIHFKNESDNKFTVQDFFPLDWALEFKITPITGSFDNTYLMTLNPGYGDVFRNIITIEPHETYSLSICKNFFEGYYRLANGSYKVKLNYSDIYEGDLAMAETAVPPLTSNEIIYEIQRDKKLTPEEIGLGGNC